MYRQGQSKYYAVVQGRALALLAESEGGSEDEMAISFQAAATRLAERMAARLVLREGSSRGSDGGRSGSRGRRRPRRDASDTYPLHCSRCAPIRFGRHHHSLE